MNGVFSGHKGKGDLGHVPQKSIRAKKKFSYHLKITTALIVWMEIPISFYIWIRETVNKSLQFLQQTSRNHFFTL